MSTKFQYSTFNFQLSLIRNLAANNKTRLNAAIDSLLTLTKDESTVVRWAVAFSLAKILKLGTKDNAALIPVLKQTAEKEEKDSIKKIYLTALMSVA